MFFPTQYKMKPPVSARINKARAKQLGLGGYWPMNENGGSKAFDLSENGKTGTITGAVWRDGGLFFDETDAGDVIDFGLFDWRNQSELSIVIKFRWIETGQTAEYTLLGNWSASQASILMRIEKNGDFPEIYLCEEADTQLILNATDLIINTTGSDHTQMVAVTFKGGDALRCYLNGVVSNTVISSSANMDSTISVSNLKAGIRATDYYNGYIDAIGIFNKQLSASEVALLYREPFWLFGREPIELWSIDTGAPPPTAGAMTLNTKYWGITV